MVTAFEIHFGGPGEAPGLLRDVLAERIANVPAGGNIDWVTYYFRDRRLAAELLRAHSRGVSVTVTLEGKPRTTDANDDVAAMLSGRHGLGDGFRRIALPGLPAPRGKAWKPQLHEKLYCFSHPQPIAFIGSFNPSGDNPEQRPDILTQIGDQDRGHNVLVGLSEPDLVCELVNHARNLNHSPPNLAYRLSAAANREPTAGGTRIYFWPRLRRHPILEIFRALAPTARVRIAASHIRGPGAVKAFAQLARRGVTVEILAEATLRRVPERVQRRLAAAGVGLQRFTHGVPMHLKFALMESGTQRRVAFGSFNWTAPSFWLNHEIAVISDDPELFDSFAGRWALLKRQPNISDA